jgi:predicted SAM-dependent methyltransferase
MGYSARILRDLTRKIKNLLKRSGFIVGIGRAARAGLLDIKKIYGFITRRRKFRSYLRNKPLKKLQLGTSNSPMAGWLNTDLLPTGRKIAYLDATRRFPFNDDTFDYVYSEHMIEHIEHESAVFMLRECFRVLKPGGKIRISTPDLKVYTGLHSKEKTASQNHYIEWVTHRFMPEVDYCKEVFVINNAFRAWGHQFLYDRETLNATMTRIGFEDIQYYHPGASNDENLRGIELHGSLIQCEEINQFEVFALEGRTPNPKKRI